MNVIWLLIGSFLFILLGYRFYSGYIARILGEDKNRITPAIELNDGVDYCPTKSPIVFAHQRSRRNSTHHNRHHRYLIYPDLFARGDAGPETLENRPPGPPYIPRSGRAP